ncbi:MAG TPA: phosphohydrolase, partial [Halieaceae bacterium]|nr:phosphohydrolase [Halieaceae bacterium]
MIEVVKVMVADLKPGMYVSGLDRPWLETPFVLQGFRISSEEDIRGLRSHCQYVFVDIEKSRHVDYALQRKRR